MMNIVVIHLADGNEIVGKILSENDRGIDLVDVMLIRYGLNDSGNYVFYFNKYCPYDKSYNVYFKKESIITIHRDVLRFVITNYEKSVEKMKKLNYDIIMDIMESQEEKANTTIDIDEFFVNVTKNKKLH